LVTSMTGASPLFFAAASRACRRAPAASAPRTGRRLRARSKLRCGKQRAARSRSLPVRRH